MNDSLLDFLLLRDAGTRTVLIGAMLLSIGSAAIGCFALLRRRALVGDAVAHAVLPGVTIGSRSVIGAGSVVTRDVPEGVLAVGNPCRVVRPVP